MNTNKRKASRFARSTWSITGTLLCAALLARPSCARGANPQSDTGPPSLPPPAVVHPDALDVRDTTKAGLPIPLGTILPIRLNSPLSSVKSKPGKEITGRVMQDIPLPSGVIREGSKVVGHIVAVTSATDGASAQISFQFDKLVFSHQTTAITTNLRAVAGPMEVLDAETPKSGPGEGDVWNWRTTTLIGGDIVYGVGGPVTTAENAEGVVGTGVDSGVLSRVSAKTGTRCRGAIEGNESPQALWVFSSDACGTYGLEHIAIYHAGRSNPAGLIALTSDTGKAVVPRGAAMLLRVDAVSK